MNKKLLTVALITVIVTISLAYAVEQLLIPTVGNIVTEFGLESNPPTIDWGDVYLGTPVIQSVTITNVGTLDIDSLAMTHSTTSTNIIDYTLTWDQENTALPKGANVLATFTLTIIDGTGGAIAIDVSIQE